MEVKGSAVVSTPGFVQDRFGSRFNEWMDSLSNGSREIMKDRVLISNWYPLQEALIEPTTKICELFYDGQDKGAWETGRFSADFALKGIYKLFVQLGSPEFLIKRASKIMSAYYRPSKMIVYEMSPGQAKAHITEFPEPNRILEMRIAGWMERALEISGCRDVDVKISSSLTKGDPVTEFATAWK